MDIRPAKDLSSSRTPDTAEDSKPTAELPLLLRPVAALQPRVSTAERSRSLYFRCKKQQKQLGASVARRGETGEGQLHAVEAEGPAPGDLVADRQRRRQGGQTRNGVVRARLFDHGPDLV